MKRILAGMNRTISTRSVSMGSNSGSPLCAFLYKVFEEAHPKPPTGWASDLGTYLRRPSEQHMSNAGAPLG